MAIIDRSDEEVAPTHVKFVFRGIETASDGTFPRLKVVVGIGGGLNDVGPMTDAAHPKIEITMPMPRSLVGASVEAVAAQSLQQARDLVNGPLLLRWLEEAHQQGEATLQPPEQA